jgi:hypothetical protein
MCNDQAMHAPESGLGVAANDAGATPAGGHGAGIRGRWGDLGTGFVFAPLRHHLLSCA